MLLRCSLVESQPAQFRPTYTRISVSNPSSKRRMVECLNDTMSKQRPLDVPKEMHEPLEVLLSVHSRIWPIP